MKSGSKAVYSEIDIRESGLIDVRCQALCALKPDIA
jgi:hypothetical protein